ncbi:MAG: hypothetical protein ACLU6Y_05825 [Ruminococcus sp.]
MGVDYGAGSYPGGETSSNLWTLLKDGDFLKKHIRQSMGAARIAAFSLKEQLMYLLLLYIAI